MPHIPPPKACSHHQSESRPQKYEREAQHLRSFPMPKQAGGKKNPLGNLVKFNMKGTSAHWNQQQSMLIGLTTLAPSRLIHRSSQKSLPLPFQLALKGDLRLLPALRLNENAEDFRYGNYGGAGRCVLFWILNQWLGHLLLSKARKLWFGHWMSCRPDKIDQKCDGCYDRIGTAVEGTKRAIPRM